MAYTLAGIRQRVINDKLDDTSYDTAIVDRFINDAQRSIFNTYELPFMEKTFAGTLPDGGYVFTFPGDYQTVQSLKVVDPTGDRQDITANYIPFRQFNRAYPVPTQNPKGKPVIWTLHGNRLYFSQPTDKVYTLELYYVKKADTLIDDGQVPELPSEWEELLVLGAYYRVLERNEDFDLASFYKNGDYTDELDKLESRLGKRQTGKPNAMPQPLRMARHGRRNGRR